ncbi:MAG: hypothetical protein IT176_02925 [Acidobacteria bacterium]|nr:hypothetical protein [Acidobacteriota bacterium]
MTTQKSAIEILPGERYDRQLVKRLLAHLARRAGWQWRSLDFPEERIHSRDAVQVIAMEASGRTTAIEHLPLAGFSADTQDGPRFRPALAALEQDPALRAPGWHVDLAVPVAHLPASIDARLLAGAVRGWCARRMQSAPEGESTHVVMISGTAVKIQVEKTACPGECGRLAIAGAHPPGNFEAIVRERLQQKLPRLSAASADRRVLLIERGDSLWSLAHLRLELEGAAFEFPDLRALSGIWMADTVERIPGDEATFRLVRRNDDDEPVLAG